MIFQNEFLEHADVFGNYYGTARCFLEKAKAAGNDLLLDIDVQGAAQIKKKLPEAVSIFILPPSRQALEARLRRRKEDSEEVIQRRLNAASKEIQNYPNYDYVLVNDQIEESIDQLKAIVLHERIKHGEEVVSGERERENLRKLAEECRQKNIRPRLEPILRSFGI